MPAQLAALDAAAKAKGAAGFAAATLDQRRAIVEAAIADAKVERLPARPTGAHIVTDLMGHYFNSSGGPGSLLPRRDRPRRLSRTARF